MEQQGEHDPPFDPAPGAEIGAVRRWRHAVDRRTDPRTVGDDPDYRFTLANERTFLAWLRTSLALAAGGLAAIHLLPDAYGAEFLGLALLGLGFVTAATSFRRWFRTERAMRLGEPLPPSRLPRFVAYALSLFALAAVALFVVEQLR